MSHNPKDYRAVICLMYEHPYEYDINMKYEYDTNTFNYDMI